MDDISKVSINLRELVKEDKRSKYWSDLDFSSKNIDFEIAQTWIEAPFSEEQWWLHEMGTVQMFYEVKAVLDKYRAQKRDSIVPYLQNSRIY